MLLLGTQSHMGPCKWEVKHVQDTFHSSTPIVFSKAPIQEKFLQEEGFHFKEIDNHLCPPQGSMFSPVLCNPSSLDVLSATSVPVLHCLISMLCHFQIDTSYSPFLLLSNIQRVWSQPIPRPVFNWDGACHQRAWMKEKPAPSGIRFIVTDYSQFLLLVAVMF